MRPKLRRLAAASATAVLLSSLVACGGDDSDSTAKDDSAPSASSSEASLLSSLSEGDTVDPTDFVKTVTEGIENSTTAHMTMKMSLGSAGSMTAEGDVDYTTTPPSTAITMTMPGATGAGEMDVRVVDGIMYMSMGELTQGKFWKIDPSDPDGPMASLGMDGFMDQMDPAKSLEAMENSVTKVTYVGEDNGLHHYEMTMDMEKVLESSGSDLPSGATADLPDTVTYDLWLDDQGRYSKMAMNEMPVAGAGNVSMQLMMTGWGEDVSIEAPPADQITKMPDMGGMMGGTSSSSAAG